MWHDIFALSTPEDFHCRCTIGTQTAVKNHKPMISIEAGYTVQIAIKEALFFSDPVAIWKYLEKTLHNIFASSSGSGNHTSVC